MIRYVAGFAFNQREDEVMLILKQKPAWQAGKLNAIGGKIEQEESPLLAMIREFREETGLMVPDWRRFCILRGQSNENETWEVHFFITHLNTSIMAQATSMEREEVVIKFIESVGVENAIPNLPWLIQMAVCMDNDLHRAVKEYVISEQY